MMAAFPRASPDVPRRSVKLQVVCTWYFLVCYFAFALHDAATRERRR